MPDSDASIDQLLRTLLLEAGLDLPFEARPMSGLGFSNELHRARLQDGREVVLRVRRHPAEPEYERARFIEAAGVPVPTLMAANAAASLYEFVPGRTLGELLDKGECPSWVWPEVGVAFRALHEISFPSRLAGEFTPTELVLRPSDPVTVLHGQLDRAKLGLLARAPGQVASLADLHVLVDRAAPSLRNARNSLLHGDVNMWNIIVSGERIWLIDWDEPRVGDPAMEVALLDKHAWLFNGVGLDDAFFAAYGESAEPNTSLHRVIQALVWLGSDDWDSFDRPFRPPALRARARVWLSSLRTYAEDIEFHLERLRTIVA